MPSLKQGVLIAVEGIDGSGKSTLVCHLETILQHHTLKPVITKEPGNTPLGKQLRTLLQEQPVAVNPYAEFLLFAADRAQHFSTLVIPALQEKKLVLSDRMADSSLVYQGYGRGLDKRFITSVNAWAMRERLPDLTLYVRVPAALARERIQQRNVALTAFEKNSQDFVDKLIHGFEELYKDRGDVVVLDGTQEPETLAGNACDHIMQWLNKKNLYE